MNPEHAKQIAHLLNSRNHLIRGYDAQAVLDRAGDFIYELEDDTVVACIEVKRVQWYQWEVCHLTVAPENEGRGLGSLMIRKAEERAKSGGARIIQCTIRVGNVESERAFQRNRYTRVSEFYYPHSGNEVAVWQKVVSYRPINVPGED
jgi:ribosomal protein S18 acetylase RimI-like enzyme